jgi:hypothetical protein
MAIQARLTLWLIGTSLLVSCRTEIPSTPPPEDRLAVQGAPPTPPPASVMPTEDGRCHNEAFSACEYACDDAECFEWCAGSTCMASLREVASCLGPAPVTEEGRLLYDDRWTQVCASRCEKIVVDSCQGGICEDDWCAAGPRIGEEQHLVDLLQPPRPREAALLGVLSGDEGFGSVGHSSMILLDVKQADPKHVTLSQLIASDLPLADEVAGCIEKPARGGTRVVAAVHLAASGLADRVEIEHSDDEPARTRPGPDGGRDAGEAGTRGRVPSVDGCQ